MNALVARLLDALPQTQCTRCGYPDCAGYAEAIARGDAAINQCPPGGAEGVARLAAISGHPVIALSAAHGAEAPRTTAVIDEAWCIGCTLCIQACPTDAILGSNKRMHTVVADHCTGCELCIPVCPVDCIALEHVSGSATGWSAWSPVQAMQARARYEARQQRQVREAREHADRLEAKARAKLADLPALTHDSGNAQELARKRSVIEAALERARARRDSTNTPG
jgi:electron transport complex protein RnfB